MKTASTIYEFIADEDFLPDYEAWKQEMLRWKDKEGILEGYTAEWFSHAVEDYINYNDELKAKWESIVAHSPQSPHFRDIFLMKTIFLKRLAGMKTLCRLPSDSA